MDRIMRTISTGNNETAKVK